MSILSPDGRLLAALASSRPPQVRLLGVALLDLDTGKEVRRFAAVDSLHYSLGGFSRDGRTLAVCQDEKVQMLEVASGLVRGSVTVDAPPNQTHITAMALSPDGEVVAVGALTRVPGPLQSHERLTIAISLRDVAGGTLLRRFVGFTDQVRGLAFSPDSRLLVSSGLENTALVWDVAGSLPQRGARPAEPGGAEIEVLWGELAHRDAVAAYRAVVAMSRTERSVSFLVGKLKDNPGPDLRRVDRLLADLDSEEFEVRERATRELGALGELARPGLQKALEQKPSPEVRRRVQGLLEQLVGQKTSPEQLRAWREVRAVEVLELIGSPAAKQALADLARSNPETNLTREAKASLKRLAFRKATAPE
jgi:hypothetical protein